MVTQKQEPNADGSTVEIIGFGILKSSINITNNYKLIEIMVYDGEFNTRTPK